MEPKIIQININDILPNRFQPRIAFNEDKLNELSESIKKYGVIQPITVRQIGNKYEIIAGERRYKASQLAGLSTIPAIVQNFSDEISSEVALIENVQREDLTAIEEAISYKKILDMGTITQEKLADKLGVSQPAVANKLRLLQLSEKVQDALMENKISERHARSLLKLKNKVKQEEMLHRIINERLTVRKTDEEIKKILDNHDEENIKSFIPTPEEIEILDIINSFKMEEKKEEEKMNSNDPMNSFNIPSVNIEDSNNNIEPMNSEIRQNNVLENNVVEPNLNISSNNIINPGFMDIDKIEREATDIKLNENKASVDLMNSPGSIIENNLNNSMPKGKFFDVIPSIQNKMEEDDSSEGSGSRIIGGSIFNDDSKIFGNQNIDNNSIKNENLNNIDFNSNVFNNPIIEPVEVKDVYPANFENTSITNNFQENPFNVTNENKVIEEVPSVVPTAPIMEESYEPKENIMPANELNNNYSNINENKVMEEVPSVVPTVPIMEESYEPKENIMPANELNNNYSNINENKVIEESPSIVPTVPIMEENNYNKIEEPVLETINTIQLPKEKEPVINISAPLSFNMREAIQMIRNITDRLERMGHRLDSEEMDLNDRYEIKITLYK